MEVERREEVEEEGGELVQAVEHLKRYVIYQSIYQSSFIEDCERPYNDILYIIVYKNHHLSKTVEDQAVLPHHDRGHQSPHTQHIVGLGRGGIHWY